MKDSKFLINLAIFFALVMFGIFLYWISFIHWTISLFVFCLSGFIVIVNNFKEK